MRDHSKVHKDLAALFTDVRFLGVASPIYNTFLSPLPLVLSKKGLTRDDFFACCGSIIHLSALHEHKWVRLKPRRSMSDIRSACYRIYKEPKVKYCKLPAAVFSAVDFIFWPSQRERYLIFLIPLFKESWKEIRFLKTKHNNIQLCKKNPFFLSPLQILIAGSFLCFA